MQPSQYQLDFYSEVETGQGNLFLDAKAGSGKTTTCIEALNRLPARRPGEYVQLQIRMLAFNKSIADELKRRVPSWVTCSTFHSLCFGALKQVIGHKVEVNANKVRLIAYRVVGDRNNPDTANIIRLVSLAKNLGIGVLIEASTMAFQTLIFEHDLQFDNETKAIQYAMDILRQSNFNHREIDYDDMIYLALLLNAPFVRLDYCFIDEAQDLNPTQIEVLKRCRGTQSRFFFVGDPHQAIYGFRGAGVDAVKQIVAAFACKTLPLSVCYRCGSEIIKRAQKHVPDIVAWEGTGTGKVEELHSYTPEIFVPGSAVLCRNVAPVVGLAYGLLKRDVPCAIIGRDIGKQLIDLITRMRATNLEHLQDQLRKWRETELIRVEKEHGSPESVTDKFDCVMAFIRGLDMDSQTISSLVAKIELMFVEQTDASRVSLCSIHKAKGLEWSRVFILDRELCPSKYARTEKALRQERNLEYVATTRAKQHLIFIWSDRWDEKQKGV